MIIAAVLVLLGTAVRTPTASVPPATAQAPAPATASADARADTAPPRTRAEVQAEAIDALRIPHEAGRH